MDKNINRVKWLLGIGATLIYMAALSCFVSTIGTDALKVVVNALISLALLAVSIGIEDNFKLKGLGKYSFVLGLMSFLSTFIYVGIKGMLGEYLSFDGGGTYLYTTFIYLLVVLFAYVTTLRYKDYIFIYIKYSALLVSLYTFMCHFSSNLLANMAVIGVIILFLNIIKLKNRLTGFAKGVSLCYAFITCCYIVNLSMSEHLTLLFSWLIVIMNAINIFIVVYRDKRFVINLLAIILFLINTTLITSTLIIDANVTLALVLAVTFYSIFEILINQFNVVSDNQVSILFKVFLNIGYLALISDVNTPVDYAIVAGIIFVSSLINSFLYKNDKNEYKIMPLKLMFAVSALFRLVDFYLLPMSDSICYILLDLAALMVMYFTKDDTHKNECVVLTLFYSYSLLFFDDLTPGLYVASGLIAMLNYYFIILRSEEKTSTKGRLYYGLLLFMLLVSLDNFDINNSKYLIASLVFGVLTIISYSDKIGFAITLPALYITLLEYINGLNTISASASSFLCMILNYVCFVLWINNLSIKDDVKDVWLSLAMIFISLIALSSDMVLNTVLAIVVAVIMIYYGIKNPNHNAIHISGIIIVIMSLLSLTSFLGEAKLFIYLLIVGGGIIYFVIRLAAKGIPEEKVEAKVEEKTKEVENIELPKEIDNKDRKICFCHNCGNKLNGDEVFCGKCGTKLQQ